MGRLVGGLEREHCWECFGVRQGVSSGLLNKPVHVEFGGSLISGQVYVANKRITPRQSPGSMLCLLQLPAMLHEEGALAKAIPAERCLETMCGFEWSCGSSLPGQTEAAVTHLHGNMRVSEYPHLCEAVPNLSTAFDHQLDLSHAAVKKTIYFSGSKILGGSRLCQENLWTAIWKLFYFK